MYSTSSIVVLVNGVPVFPRGSLGAKIDCGSLGGTYRCNCTPVQCAQFRQTDGSVSLPKPVCRRLLLRLLRSSFFVTVTTDWQPF